MESQNLRKLTGFILACALVGGASEPALARGRAGGARTGSFGRQGSYTGAQGRTSSAQGQGTWSRGQGMRSRNYEGTRTGPGGQTQQVERNQNATRTGQNSWHRDGGQTVTGANGQTRTRTSSGDGTIQKTENGYTKSYDGTVTTNKGQVINVDRGVDVTKNADGTVSKDRSVDYTNSEGASLGSGQSSSLRTPGQGTTTTGSYTNGRGNSSTYEGSSTPSGDHGVNHQQTWTGAQGQTRSSAGQARWQYVDGRWVRSYEGGATTP